MNNTTEFLKQLDRMCNSYDACAKCPIFNLLKGDGCTPKITRNPEKAQSIVSGWVKANPETTANTILSEFLAKFPDTKLTEYGTPKFCVKILGYNYMDQDMCDANKGQCSLCWNTPLLEEEKAVPKPAPMPPMVTIPGKEVIVIGMTDDNDPDGAYFDHTPLPSKVPEFPTGMDNFIRNLCADLGWHVPNTTA